MTTDVLVMLIAFPPIGLALLAVIGIRILTGEWFPRYF